MGIERYPKFSWGPKRRHWNPTGKGKLGRELKKGGGNFGIGGGGGGGMVGYNKGVERI